MSLTLNRYYPYCYIAVSAIPARGTIYELDLLYYLNRIGQSLFVLMASLKLKPVWLLSQSGTDGIFYSSVIVGPGRTVVAAIPQVTSNVKIVGDMYFFKPLTVYTNPPS